MAASYGRNVKPIGQWSKTVRGSGQDRLTRVRKPFVDLWPNGQAIISYRYETEAVPATFEEEWGWLPSCAPEGNSSPEGLTLSIEPNSHKDVLGSGRVRGKYGLKGITSYGRKMVKNGAFLLQEKYRAKGLCFCTITIPQMSFEGRKVVAEKWGEVVRQLSQHLSRRLAASKQQQEVVLVTELQQKRYERFGEAYLHLHVVFPSRSADGKSWVVDISSFREWFGRLLERVSGEKITTLPRIEMKAVRKSAENYLGKYMSKGSEDISAIVEDLGEDAVPGQQWGMTKALRERIKKGMLSGFASGAIVQDYLDMMVAGILPCVGWWKRVEVSWEGRIFTVAWIGKISPQQRREIGLEEREREEEIVAKVLLMA